MNASNIPSVKSLQYKNSKNVPNIHLITLLYLYHTVPTRGLKLAGKIYCVSGFMLFLTSQSSGVSGTLRSKDDLCYRDTLVRIQL